MIRTLETPGAIRGELARAFADPTMWLLVATPAHIDRLNELATFAHWCGFDVALGVALTSAEIGAPKVRVVFATAPAGAFTHAQMHGYLRNTLPDFPMPPGGLPNIIAMTDSQKPHEQAEVAAFLAAAADGALQTSAERAELN